MTETTSRRFDRKMENKNDNYNSNTNYNSKDRSTMNPLQKHLEFFDRKKKGYITPLDTWVGFRSLGYNIIMCLIAVMLIHGTMSYASGDSWIPDIFLRVFIKNIHRCKHGSDSETYDYQGNFVQEKMDKIFKDFSSDNNSFTFEEMIRMTNAIRNANDFYGWLAAKFEWCFLYVLCQQDGRISKKDVLGVVDGSLFYDIAKKNQRLKENKKEL